jgi:integrase/recombinase XerD
MIDSIFVWKSVRERHRRTPLFHEREMYLGYLFQQGVSLARIRVIANLLLHVIRLLEIAAFRPIEAHEIADAGARWAADEEFHITRKPGPQTSRTFQDVASNWLKFHGMLVLPAEPAPPFYELMKQFLHAMKVERGLAPDTLRGYGSRAWYFLKWFGERSNDLSLVRVVDTDEFLETKRAAGWGARSLASQCQAMRTFFGYAESQGWCMVGIRRSIKSPRIPKYQEAPRGPQWKEVRRLLRSTQGEKPSDLRAYAILLLCSIYGLRASEIVHLTLDDFDWRNETLTVRRAKRGRTQQFPLQYEVGEAVVQYLQNARPHCSCRNLFVTRSTPYRPIRATAFWSVVGKRMQNLCIESPHFGPHALRHACATQLLKKGSSLRDIADFLGHRDTKCVSIYAKYDTRSLRALASFSLAGVM